MADEKISALTEKLSIASDDVFVIVDSVGGLNKKIKFSSLGVIPGGEDIAATLAIGNNAGGATLANLGALNVATINNAGGFPLTINAAGDLIVTAGTGGGAAGNLNATGLAGTILTKNGTAANVSVGNSATNGLIFGVNTVSIVTNGVEKWMVNSSGALNPIVANTYDIGGSTTIRDIGIGRNAIVGGIISLAAGAVGAPSLARTGALTTGIYFVSATQGGFSSGGVLVGGWDANGLFTGTITEQVAGVGVAVTGTAGSLILMQNVTDEAYIKMPASTVDHANINLDPTGVDPTNSNQGDIHYDSATKGFHFEGIGGARTILIGGATGFPIKISQDTLWTIHTGTGSRASFDADWTQAISGVPTQAEVEAVRNQVIVLQKRLAAMQDHLMTTMNLLTA